MKKAVLLLAAVCLMLAACGAQNETVPTTPPTEAPTIIQTEVPTDTPTQAPTDAPDASIPTTLPVFPVAPLPTTIDTANLDNCTVAISLEKGGAGYGSGITRIKQMEFTVYTYDLYDLVDISRLSGGDTIIIRGEDVVIEALELREDGTVVINGGLDIGGYELRTDDSTVYYETGYSDQKSWQESGSVCMEVSPDFVFTDSSDLDNGPISYTFDDLTAEEPPFFFSFGPQNTTVTIENGLIVSMERVYTP